MLSYLSCGFRLENVRCRVDEQSREISPAFKGGKKDFCMICNERFKPNSSFKSPMKSQYEYMLPTLFAWC